MNKSDTDSITNAIDFQSQNSGEDFFDDLNEEAAERCAEERRQALQQYDKQKRIAAAKNFFNQLYGKIPAHHFVYLIKFAGGNGIYSFDTADENFTASMAQRAIELSDEGVDVWHSVNSVACAPHDGKRGGEKEVSYQTAVVVDIDIAGDAHANKNLVSDFNEAKFLLPFEPSLIIDSGYGLHAYYIFDTPIEITEDNRAELKRRNKLLLDVIRLKANGKKIDAVDDLPRIMRTLGTFNYKLGKDHAPLCHIVEDSGARFTPADLDEKLNALIRQSAAQPSTPIKSARTPAAVTYDADDDADLKSFRIRRMLDYINVTDGEYEKWCYEVGMALYNEFGGSNEGLNLFEQWSKTQPEFKEGEPEYKWSSFHYDPNGYTIGSLFRLAEAGGYDEKETQRDYYRLRPDKAKRRYLNKAAQIVAQLADCDVEKNKALEKLRALDKFDSDTVTTDEIITCAAFARWFEPTLYSELIEKIKQSRIDKQGNACKLKEFGRATNDRMKELKARHDDLLARQTENQAQIKTQNFIVDNADWLNNVTLPDEYSFTANGVEKIIGQKSELVCRRPVIIEGRIHETDTGKDKLTLSYKTSEGIYKAVPPTERAIVFNKNKLVDLTSYGLPVTTSNAARLVEYLDAFFYENESSLPMTYTVPRCGWYNFGGKDCFIDPRLNCVVDVGDEKNISVKVDKERSEFAKHLKAVGSLDKWKEVYQLIKDNSDVARLMVAAAFFSNMLEVLGERNFLLHVYAPTRAGKTTALKFAASAFGSEKIVRSFDATKNGLAGAAADVNDFPFFIDEKQVADGRLNLAELVYALANGIGRTKLNRDSTLKKLHDWRTVAIATGETELLPDNATGGAYTRCLSIKAPKIILPPDVCKIIHDTIKTNYGLALPPVIEKLQSLGRDNLRGEYAHYVDVFTEEFSAILPEYCRYVTGIAISDAVLNSALFNLAFNESLIHSTVWAAEKVVELIPTRVEIDDIQREKDFVLGFIAQHQNCFINQNTSVPANCLPKIYGKLKEKSDFDNVGFTYITVQALKDACDAKGFDYRKVVADLIADGFFMPSTTIRKGCKKPTNTCQKKLGEINATCYRIPNQLLDDKK